MDFQRLQNEADSGDPEAKYLLFKERERRGEITLPETPKTHSRSCFRCKAELTDELSLSRGLGPTCWGHVGKSEHQVDPDIIRLKELHGKFLSQIDFEYWESSIIIAKMGEHLYKDKLTKVACKEMCRKILWAISFGLPTEINRILLDMIEALGYPILVKLLESVAVIGKATVSAEGREFLMASPRPRSIVSKALRESGGRFEWKREVWVWPESRAEEGASVIKQHFLNVQGLDEALEVLKNLPPEGPSKRLERFLLKEEKGEIWVKTPFNPAFIDSLKKVIPWMSGGVKCREWYPPEKAWIIRTPQFIQVAKDLIVEHYLES